MLVGASVFMFLERENEENEKRMYNLTLQSFYDKYPTVDKKDVEYLLKKHSVAEAAGFVGNKRPRWDFPGSFYFVGTVVSTIGKLVIFSCEKFRLCSNISLGECNIILSAYTLYRHLG